MMMQWWIFKHGNFATFEISRQEVGGSRSVPFWSKKGDQVGIRKGAFDDIFCRKNHDFRYVSICFHVPYPWRIRLVLVYCWHDWGILMGSMLAYIPAPWILYILWDMCPICGFFSAPTIAPKDLNRFKSWASRAADIRTCEISTAVATSFFCFWCAKTIQQWSTKIRKLLVGVFSPPLWKIMEFVSWDDEIPYISIYYGKS